MAARAPCAPTPRRRAPRTRPGARAPSPRCASVGSARDRTRTATASAGATTTTTTTTTRRLLRTDSPPTARALARASARLLRAGPRARRRNTRTVARPARKALRETLSDSLRTATGRARTTVDAASAGTTPPPRRERWRLRCRRARSACWNARRSSPAAATRTAPRARCPTPGRGGAGRSPGDSAR